MMGTGIASGENRAREAAMKAITSPLLEGVSIDGAHAVLLNVTCGSDLTIDEISEAASTVQEAAHDDVHVYLGTVLDDNVGDEMHITVIATGIDNELDSGAAEMLPRQAVGSRSARQAPAAQGAPLETVLRAAPPRAAQAGAGNRNIPSYMRRESGSAGAAFAGGGHSPGEDDFIFEENEFETPAFLRKQAN
jgi:cell division protein FtsZ